MASFLHRPILTSLDGVEMWAHFDDGQYLYHTFCYFTPDDIAWHGTIKKRFPADNPTLVDVNQLLQEVDEATIHPEIPASPPIKVAHPFLQNVYIKRPGLVSHDPNVPDFWSKVLLHEVLIMERIPPHPNIITYHGCRVHRGRITGIVLESLDKTLMQAPVVPNIPAFLAELQSAVNHLHSLGLAHNDINPYNIMIRHGCHPVLIDFGACAPPGDLVNFGGTRGWYEKPFWHSAVEHDVYPMDKLRTWLENVGKEEGGKVGL